MLNIQWWIQGFWSSDEPSFGVVSKNAGTGVLD